MSRNFANYSHITSTALLLVGSPGTGKSTRALEFPRPYVFDADRNLSGPMRYFRKIGRDLSEVKFDYADQDDEGRPVTPFFRWMWMHKCLTRAVADNTIDTIILDGLTTIQEIVKDDIFRQRVGPQNMGNNKFLMITEQNRSMAQLTEPEWGIYGRYWNELLTALKNTHKIVVVTGHDEARKNETNSVWEYTLSLQGAQRYKFAGLFSDVILCGTKLAGVFPNEKKEFFYRTCAVGEHDKRGIKDSFQLEAVFSDFSLLINHLIETKKNATDPCAG